MKRCCIVLNIILLLLITCKKLPKSPDDYSNPLDPKDPSYSKPEIAFIQPSPENDTSVNSDTVTFRWRGNHAGMLYSYRLGNDRWSSFNTDTTVRYTLLDDGDYEFYLRGVRSVSKDSTSIISRSFKVDAIHAQSLYMVPRRVKLSGSNFFEIELWGEVNTPVSSMGIIIEYSPASYIAVNKEDDEYQITFDRDTTTSLLWQNDSTEVISLFKVDGDAGRIFIDCGIWGANKELLPGRGRIATIQFHHITGSYIYIGISEESKFKDGERNDLPINQFIGTHVYQ